VTGLITIAHQAGNDLSAARQALASGVHLVEADVHLFRGRLEMRHHEVVMTWPVDTPGGLAHARHLGVGGVISKNSALLDDVLAVGN
jgi:glycerophosphoryl diester phosphodiesterase